MSNHQNIATPEDLPGYELEAEIATLVRNTSVEEEDDNENQRTD